MSQRQQLTRIFEIDRAIRAREYPNAAYFIQKLEVGRRVIFKDLAHLRDQLHAPIVYDRQHGGWYYSDPAWCLPNIMVTEGELVALFFSVELAHHFLPAPLEKALRSTVDKIAASVTDQVSIDPVSLHAHYSFSGPVLIGGREETLLDLYHAINRRQRVEIRYYTASRDKHTQRVIEPYHLQNVRGDWYLIAFDFLRQAVRNFAVSRIESWQILPQTFTPDPNFDINRYMKSAFQSERGGKVEYVVIRFDAYQARYIRERRWHESQTIEELPDGGLILRFLSGGLGEVQRWVMQYGSHAEVLEPESLRQAVREEMEKALKMY